MTDETRCQYPDCDCDEVGVCQREQEQRDSEGVRRAMARFWHRLAEVREDDPEGRERALAMAARWESKEPPQ